MPSEVGPTGYRQPVQARAFGTGAMVATGLLGIMLLSIRVIAPPTQVADAAPMAVFVAEAIPLDQPALDRAAPPPAPTPAPPLPAHRPSLPTAAPTSPTVPTVPVIADPSSVGQPSAAPLAQPADAVAFPPLPQSGTKPIESPGTTAPAASATAAAAADWRARLLGHLKRYRRYPRQAEAARQQGVVRIAITLHRSGEVIAVELVHGSGYPLLDMEARTTVRRAVPLPAVEDAVPGDPVTVEVPIEFALHR